MYSNNDIHMDVCMLDVFLLQCQPMSNTGCFIWCLNRCCHYSRGHPNSNLHKLKPGQDLPTAQVHEAGPTCR